MANGKIVLFGDKAREGLLAGFKKLHDAVAATLGPGGRNVLIKSPLRVYSTKDGVTVAREITLKDPVENAGAEACKLVANQANDNAGDGTTTATVLAWSLLQNGQKRLRPGVQMSRFKDGVLKALDDVKKELEKLKKDVDETDYDTIYSIAKIAGNDNDIGKHVADAYKEVGKSGVVTFSKGVFPTTEVKYRKGFRVDKGYESPYFCTDLETMTAVYDNPSVLVTTNRLSNANDIFEFLDKYFTLQQNDRKALVIFCSGVDAEPMGLLITNRIKANMPVAVVSIPGYGDSLDEWATDIAKACGCQVISEVAGDRIHKSGLENLGTKLTKIVIRKNETELVFDQEGEFKEHVEHLKSMLTNEDLEEEQKAPLKERIGILEGKVADINIGSQSNEDFAEKAFRFQDAINAVRGALEEGILPGGGTSLSIVKGIIGGVTITLLEPDNAAGYKTLWESLEAPMLRIMENADQEITLPSLEDGIVMGRNVATGELGDLIAMGVIDPYKVVRIGLEAAVNVASLYLSTECVIVDEPIED